MTVIYGDAKFSNYKIVHDTCYAIRGKNILKLKSHLCHETLFKFKLLNLLNTLLIISTCGLFTISVESLVLKKMGLLSIEKRAFPDVTY